MANVVQTIRDRCKRCYHCVRHCPASAIRVVDGQATVVEERCIACGNCFRVCAQQAKMIEDSTATVREFLAGGGEVVAALAPSFPAAFHPARPGQVVASLRRLGFTRVVEVAFGADLVARRYRTLLASTDQVPLLTTPCPALVAYVEKYLPDLIPSLAPIVSPMVALGRAVKQKHWPEARVVFIGPCTGKKRELDEPELAGAVDAALTFEELRTMLGDAGVALEGEADGEFDAPRAALGRAFPLTGGLLKAAAIGQDVLDSDILVTDGMLRVKHLLEELNSGVIAARFVDALLCEGCIGGPVMTASVGDFVRRDVVISYVREQPQLSPEEAEAYYAQYDDVDLSREFCLEPVNAPVPSEEELRAVLAKENKFTREDELDCGSCGYGTCREKAIAVCQGLADVGMCLPYLIDESQKALEQLASSHAELASAQERLAQTEKLAAMGQLAAGVAHQVNNPLSTVLLYSHILLRELPKNDPKREDIETIAAETTRCKTIVADLLNFARENHVNAESHDLNDFLEGILDVAAKGIGSNVRIVRRLAPGLPPVDVDHEQLTQALMNVIENACEAMPEGGTLEAETSRADPETVQIRLSDSGSGIPEDALPHLLEPFFTTKPMGQGTGLGLALADGVIKMHRGHIRAANRPEGGATFTITLPIGEGERSPAPELIIG